ncbi:hypothetical protein M0R45_029799 [Rubus argutus]|uniref:Endonuclease/exonuclease/phosphatase domain-containing protein n=1 Tax=Rubus argutus TaxID=59490 RepID=A0AAW1WBK9_RUBAR
MVIRYTSFRSQSWALLRRISSTVTGAWFVFGDFNELVGVEEKLGGCVRPSSQVRKFHETILDCGLLEVEFSGSPFTWSNGHTWERLDRGFINQGGSLLWPNLIEHHVDAGASDHLPLIFLTDGGNLRTSPRQNRRFLFEPVWAHERSCEEVIQTEWGRPCGNGHIMGKFLRLGTCLKKWRQGNVGEYSF